MQDVTVTEPVLLIRSQSSSAIRLTSDAVFEPTRGVGHVGDQRMLAGLLSRLREAW